MSSSLQGFSALNDTPHMVTEQTRSVVESEFENASFFLFTSSSLFQFLSSDHLFTLMVWLNNLSLRCAESDGWHRQKHQQLFQNIPGAELPVKLYNLYQPCSRQDWGPLPGNWQNGLLQVNPHPKSWQNCKTGLRCDISGFIFSDLPARLLWKWYKPVHLLNISSISTFILSGKVVIPATVCSQVDRLYYSVLHGCPGPGLQLPGPALRHPGIRQARLTHNTRLHLKHGGNDADGVSLLSGSKLFIFTHFAAYSVTLHLPASISASTLSPNLRQLKFG